MCICFMSTFLWTDPVSMCLSLNIKCNKEKEGRYEAEMKVGDPALFINKTLPLWCGSVCPVC